jgi:predicted ATPase/DNA-binding SARP family transcriptional activator
MGESTLHPLSGREPTRRGCPCDAGHQHELFSTSGDTDTTICIFLLARHLLPSHHQSGPVPSSESKRPCPRAELCPYDRDMRFSVLGPVAVTEDGSNLSLGGWKQRAVLVLLLQAANEMFSLDRIITDIWGDEALPKARDAVYTYVSNLRRSIGKERIEHGPAGYRLVVAPDELDAFRFESESERADRLMGSAPEKTARLLGDALAMWRGRAYEGHEDLPTIAPEANRLDELRTSSRENLFEAQLRAGETPEPAEIEALCQEHELREKPWSLLMRAEYRAGRQADALRAYQRFCQVLGGEMGIEPSPALVRLEEQILLNDPSLELSLPRPTNLPSPVTSFVGRLDEQADLDEAIHRNRLVSVLGPGGAGKTRLAVETARTLLGSFSDGVWLVDLARVSDSSGALDALANALGVASEEDSGEEAIHAWLAGRQLLIILDNCEHVREEAGRLASGVLERAAGVKVLATSRVALNQPGERRLQLLGLSSGEDNNDAGELFADRAQAVGGSVDESDDAVTALCQRLEGLPLAIELAASRTNFMSVAEIESHLAQGYDLLVGEHPTRDIHKSLATAISWSTSLLEESLRAGFEALGVFEGPFTAEAAASVLKASTIEAVADLNRLSDASLVVAHPARDEPTSYRLLEPIRAFARSRLIKSGHWDRAVSRHDQHYLAACRRQRLGMFGDGRIAAIHAVERELAEYLVAFDRIQSRTPEEALPFVWVLGHYWFTSRIGAGYRRMSSLIDRVGDQMTIEYADALTISSWVGMYANDWERAIPWVDRAVSIYEELGDQLGLAYAHARKGHWAFGRGDIPTAMSSLTSSIEICDRIGYQEGKAWPMVLVGQARAWADDTSDEVYEMLLTAKELFAATGDNYGVVHAGMVIGGAMGRPLSERLEIANEMVEAAERLGGDNAQRPTAYHSLAYVTWEDGHEERAKGLNRACVRSALASGTLITLGLALMQASYFAGFEGDAEGCALLRGAGEAHFAFEMPPFHERALAPAVEAARDALGDERYEELFEEGGNLSPEEAAALVLQHA